MTYSSNFSGFMLKLIIGWTIIAGFANCLVICNNWRKNRIAVKKREKLIAEMKEMRDRRKQSLSNEMSGQIAERQQGENSGYPPVFFVNELGNFASYNSCNCNRSRRFSAVELGNVYDTPITSYQSRKISTVNLKHFEQFQRPYHISKVGSKKDQKKEKDKNKNILLAVLEDLHCTDSSCNYKKKMKKGKYKNLVHDCIEVDAESLDNSAFMYGPQIYNYTMTGKLHVPANRYLSYQRFLSEKETENDSSQVVETNLSKSQILSEKENYSRRNLKCKEKNNDAYHVTEV